MEREENMARIWGARADEHCENGQDWLERRGACVYVRHARLDLCK
jgi:hypothetical protein